MALTKDVKNTSQIQSIYFQIILYARQKYYIIWPFRYSDYRGKFSEKFQPFQNILRATIAKGFCKISYKMLQQKCF